MHSLAIKCVTKPFLTPGQPTRACPSVSLPTRMTKSLSLKEPVPHVSLLPGVVRKVMIFYYWKSIYFGSGLVVSLATFIYSYTMKYRVWAVPNWHQTPEFSYVPFQLLEPQFNRSVQPHLWRQFFLHLSRHVITDTGNYLHMQWVIFPCSVLYYSLVTSNSSGLQSC